MKIIKGIKKRKRIKPMINRADTRLFKKSFNARFSIILMTSFLISFKERNYLSTQNLIEIFLQDATSLILNFRNMKIGFHNRCEIVFPIMSICNLCAKNGFCVICLTLLFVI